MRRDEETRGRRNGRGMCEGGGAAGWGLGWGGEERDNNIMLDR